MINPLFIYDTEQLNQLASAETVKKGLAYFAEDRVSGLELQDNILTAKVKGIDQKQPYYVELFAEQVDGALQVSCTCKAVEKICKHAVATLYRYAEQCLDQEQSDLDNAVDQAIKDRIKKGRNEVSVKLLTGNLAFGVWQAKSILSATYRKVSYQVTIRSLDKRKNYCTCPDLATNHLGTCKHIEAVIHHAGKQPEYQELLAHGAPVSFVYISWNSATEPTICLHKAGDIDAELAAQLTEFFDQNNQFKGRIPDDFNYFAEKYMHRDDLVLGEDVLLHVRQFAEDISQQIRGQEITQQIIAGQGLLKGLKTRLFPFQTEGVAFLASRGRALLADDMGLGKTLQSIAAASWLVDHAGVHKVLVICPVALKQQWGREIAKFTHHASQIIHGSVENRQVQYRSDALFYIVDYELVLRDLSVISETLKPDLLILDEAQCINNWRSKVASTIKLISSRYVFVLTGTSLENRIEDLYSLLQVVDARVLGPLWRCLLDFHITDDNGKVIAYRNLSELRRRISPVMIRRSRNQVNEQLPDRSDLQLDVPMTGQQQEYHDNALSSARRIANITQHRPLTQGESNQLMVALQQARIMCNVQKLLDKQTPVSPKLDELSGLLEQLCLQSSRKVVIFTQWGMMSEMIASSVQALGLGYIRLYSGVPTEKRNELLDQFQHDAVIQVMVATDAAGIGLNLRPATVIINMDLPWNPGVLDQRVACIHNIGQQQKIQVFLLLSDNSYEQRLAQLLKRNAELFINVDSPEAEDKVPSVSKNMMACIVNDLLGKETVVSSSDVEQPSSRHLIVNSGAFTGQADVEKEGELTINNTVDQIKQVFGHRIEQILISAGGLLVVVAQQEVDDIETAKMLSGETLPVIVIESKGLNSLQQLGAASPLADAEVIYTVDSDQPLDNPLILSAQSKLNSAEFLVSQHYYAGVLEILVSAMLNIVTAVCGENQVQVLEKATVWLYGEVLPKQLMTAEEISSIVRVISLSQNIDVPGPLVQQALSDAQHLMAHYGKPARRNTKT